MGNRYGLWTILNFEEVSPKTFEFSWEDIAFLSGSGMTDLWTVANNSLKHIKNVSIWMS